MIGGLIVQGADGCGPKTAIAATAIVQATTRKKGCKTRLDVYTYTPGATSHTLTVMRPIGRTTLSADAAAAQAVVTLTEDPGPSGNGIAANDYVAIVRPDGIIHVGVVSAWNATTKALTLTANVPTGGFANGTEVFFYGITTDTDPVSGNAHPFYPLATGAQRQVYSVTGNTVYGTSRAGEPLLLHVDNITNAGTLNWATWLFTYEPIPSQTFMGGGGDGGGEGESSERAAA